jgi:hypothetical protein
MFSTPRVKIEPALYERLKTVAAAAGYATVDEFVQHTLEKAAGQIELAESEEAIRKRLRGLGYLE